MLLGEQGEGISPKYGVHKGVKFFWMSRTFPSKRLANRGFRKLQCVQGHQAMKVLVLLEILQTSLTGVLKTHKNRLRNESRHEEEAR